MKIEDLEHNLPNGFHDVELLSVARDYGNGSCVLVMQVDAENGSAEIYRNIKILLSGLSLLIMEVPDARYPFAKAGGERFSGFATTVKYLPNLEELRQQAPEGSFFYSFFLNGLNCCIHLAATDAKLLL